MQDFDLEDDIRIVIKKYPKLRRLNNVLLGELDVFDNNDTYYTSFDVKIIIPKEYPHDFPSLYETNGKIPRVADRHINDDEGSCCVCVIQEADIRAKRGITILNFINEYVIPFFANQIYFEANGKWANGDYKHGLAGILQYYCEIFDTQDIMLIIKGFDTYINSKIKPYEVCFCKSGKKLKKCHRKAFLELGRMSKKRIQEDHSYLLLINFMRINSNNT